MLIIKALGSGGQQNKIIKPNYKSNNYLDFYPDVNKYDYMRQITLGRKNL